MMRMLILEDVLRVCVAWHRRWVHVSVYEATHTFTLLVYSSPLPSPESQPLEKRGVPLAKTSRGVTAALHGIG